MGDEWSVSDLLIIGGGINGAGIARDAVGRGLSVLLCEQDDLAAHTSSASTKLIHGGLRYLEHFEFGLVRKALQEREILMRAAPHLISPLRFVMPHAGKLRPAWMMRVGLFLYDHLGKRELLPPSESIDLRRHPAGAPLQPKAKQGFVYSDGLVDDARLVVANAQDAAERGARILTRTRVESAERGERHWNATLRCGPGGTQRVVKARCIVNAAGPWVTEVLRKSLRIESKRHLRAAKGSHIVVPRLYDHEYAYTFQNHDKRIVFAIPYRSDFTLIGTTDVEYRDDPQRVSIAEEEVSYLCAAVNGYFMRQVTPSDVTWSYSGVRPLLEDEADDLSAVTRGYELELDDGPGKAPLLSVFGGKLTTYRRLAEEAVALLHGPLGTLKPAWTARTPLPGGDIPGADFERYVRQLSQRYAWLPPELAQRYARAYGTRTERLLAGAGAPADLGAEIGDGLYSIELAYLTRYEWAQTIEDILWRRSKLGLRASPETVRRLGEWLAAHGTQAQSGKRQQCA
ncbi:MAG: glycerol-3-phosphate dehydrogenase [Burkholderiales bacterium]